MVNEDMRAEGKILDNFSKLFGLCRIRSAQWERGFNFAPCFSENGKLISIYEERDELLRERIKKEYMKIPHGIEVYVQTPGRIVPVEIEVNFNRNK